jgi:hypothetical protein
MGRGRHHKVQPTDEWHELLPELGAFRVHAALEQKRGAGVSLRSVGRVMAVHRDRYGFGKPKRSPWRKAEMPFRAKRRHEIWAADVRYVPHAIPDAGNTYVIADLENRSRCVLSRRCREPRTPRPSCPSSTRPQRVTVLRSGSSPTVAASSRPSSPGPSTGSSG